MSCNRFALNMTKKRAENEKSKGRHSYLQGGAGPGLVVKGGTSIQQVVGSNPRIRLDIFKHYIAVKIVMFVKTEIIREEAGDGPFFNLTQLPITPQAKETDKICEQA